MKKQIGAVLLAGVMACTMAASLTACGSKAKPEFVMPENGFDTESPVTIKFYHTMGSSATAAGRSLQAILDDAIARFNKLYPNIEVKHEQIGGYTEVRDQIQKELTAGNQPNLAYCYPDHVAMYNVGGAVQTLNDFLSDGAYSDYKVTQADGTEVNLGMSEEEEAQFIPGYWQEGYGFGDGTKMYTLPFSKSTEVLYYNATAFRENGWEAPKTWDDMEDLCKKIDAKYNAEGKPHVYGFGYDSEDNWFITMCEQYGSPYTAAEGNHYLFNNAKNKEFVQKFTDWYKKGYFITRALYGNSYTSALFTATGADAEKALMCIGSSAGASHQLPAKDNETGKYPFEVGIVPMPQVNVNNPKSISQGPSVCIFKSDDPQKVLASWLLLKFLTTDIAFQAEFAISSGYIPVLKESVMRTNDVYAAELDSADGGAHLAALSVKVALGQENAYFTSPAFVGSSKARDEVGALMQAAFGETKTLDQAFADAISECEYYS